MSGRWPDLGSSGSLGVIPASLSCCCNTATYFSRLVLLSLSSFRIFLSTFTSLVSLSLSFSSSSIPGLQDSLMNVGPPDLGKETGRVIPPLEETGLFPPPPPPPLVDVGEEEVGGSPRRSDGGMLSERARSGARPGRKRRGLSADTSLVGTERSPIIFPPVKLPFNSL